MYNIITTNAGHNNNCRLTRSILVQKIHNTIKTIHKELITVIVHGFINDVYL